MLMGAMFMSEVVVAKVVFVVVIFGYSIYSDTGLVDGGVTVDDGDGAGRLVGSRMATCAG